MSLIQAVLDISQTVVSGAILPIHERYAHLALAEFLRRTELYLEEFFATLDESTSFTPDFPDATTVVGIRSVSLDGRRLNMSSDRVTAKVSHGEVVFSQPLRGEVSVLIALNVDPVTGDVPFDEFSEWLEPVLAGALSRLYAMPHESWYDLNQAAYQRGMFDEGVRIATSAAKGLRDDRTMKVRYAGL